MRRLLLAAILALIPLGAAAQTAADLSLRFVQHGEPVRPVVNRVRVGSNHGNAFALAARFERGWQRATLTFSHTDVVSAPKEHDGPNPGPGAAYDEIDLLGLTIGAGRQVGVLGAAFGVGGQAMFCRFASCGSSPMFAFLLEADLDLCNRGTEDIRLCLRGGYIVVPPREGRYTWLADRAYPEREHDPGEVHGDTWWASRHLDLAIGLVLP